MHKLHGQRQTIIDIFFLFRMHVLLPFAGSEINALDSDKLDTYSIIGIFLAHTQKPQ